MKWSRQGLIFNSGIGTVLDKYTYASQPTAILLDDRIRVFFTVRSKSFVDGSYVSYITYLDCHIDDPSKILYVHPVPILSPGDPGSFDCDGTMMSDIVYIDGVYYLYYIGWQQSKKVPYITTLGLATSNDCLHFTKQSVGPVIGLSEPAPFGVARSSVLVADMAMYNGFASASAINFDMWYTCYRPWVDVEGIGYLPTYIIRYASSKNGSIWKMDPGNCILGSENESIGAPCVRKIDGLYHMWFGYRDTVNKKGRPGSYKLGYATSTNKLNWNRNDSDCTLIGNKMPWESDMICYPNILVTPSNTYMFYAGNGYGEAGFGYAKLEN